MNFFYNPGLDLLEVLFDGKGASFVSWSHEVEKPTGKRPKDGTALTGLCHLPSHNPNLLLCEMQTVIPTL